MLAKLAAGIFLGMFWWAVMRLFGASGEDAMRVALIVTFVGTLLILLLTSGGRDD